MDLAKGAGMACAGPGWTGHMTSLDSKTVSVDFDIQMTYVNGSVW